MQVILVITENDILRMATLSKLEIKEEEMALYKKEMEAMLQFAEKIEADISGEEDYVSEYEDFKDLRADKVKPSFEREDIIRNAPENCDGFIKLRKRA